MAIVGYRLSVFIKNESLNDFAGYDMADSTGGHALHLLPNDRLAPSLVQKIGKSYCSDADRGNDQEHEKGRIVNRLCADRGYCRRALRQGAYPIMLSAKTRRTLILGRAA